MRSVLQLTLARPCPSSTNGGRKSQRHMLNDQRQEDPAASSAHNALSYGWSCESCITLVTLGSDI